MEVFWMRLNRLLVVAIVLLIGVAALGSTIKVALVAPFTGLGSILGDYIKMGAQLALEEINAAGGINGDMLEMVVYDDAANPSTAANVIRRALFQDKVVAVFGPNMSSSVIGVHQLAQQAKVPMLVGATSPSFRYSVIPNDFLFRLRADDKVKVIQLVKYAVEELGIEKPGVIYGSTDYCLAALDVAKEEFPKYGIEIVAMEQIKEGDKDATGQLLKLKNAGFDGLIGLTHESEAAVTVNQLRQLQIDVPIIGFSAWGVPAFTDLAPEAAIGVYSVQGFNPIDPDPAVQAFVEAYKARWDGKEPSDPGQAYYDGMYLLADALKNVGTDGTKLAEYLANEANIVGVQGELKCDEHHNFTNVCLISQFDGKDWQIITKLY
jgi:branched-chain amino acid transport system substrate-binding protein